MQFHHHVAQARRRSAVVLHPVPVLVFPHVVAQAARLVNARVHRQIGLPAAQGVASGHPARPVGVAVHGVVGAHVPRREHVARRQVGEGHFVAAGHQVGEQVAAVGRRVGHAQHRPEAVLQDHRHSAHARLARVLQPVGVPIIPHEITQGRRAIEPDVHRQVGLAAQGVAAGESHRRPGRRRVAVQRVIAHVRQGEQITGRRRESNQVVARRQVGEQVFSAGVGGRAPHQVRGAIEQLHQHVGHARLVRFLDAVAVQILPHIVAQSGHAHRTGRAGHVGHHHPARQARGRERVGDRAVGVVGRHHVAVGEQERRPGRQGQIGHHHRVGHRLVIHNRQVHNLHLPRVLHAAGEGQHAPRHHRTRRTLLGQGQPARQRVGAFHEVLIFALARSITVGSRINEDRLH